MPRTTFVRLFTRPISRIAAASVGLGTRLGGGGGVVSYPDPNVLTC